jgi:uncharacterized protein YutE (UPF0331/DUF86 family)
VVAPDRLRKLLEQLQRHIWELREFRSSCAWAQGPGPWRDERLLGHLLQLGAECAMDIASHIAVSECLGPSKTRTGSFRKMASAGLLDPTVAEQLVKLGDYRNVIVHLYDEVTPESLLSRLQSAPELLERFAASVAKLLEEK